jgi:hypothetical protein
MTMVGCQLHTKEEEKKDTGSILCSKYVCYVQSAFAAA